MSFDYTKLPQLQHTHIIGLGHRARHGKDTVANVFLDILGSRCRRFGFADALKSHCRTVYGMTEKDGRILQDVGTRVREGRDEAWPGTNENSWLGPLFWAIHEWDQGAQGRQVAVVNDVRYENEARLIKHFGGDLICVERLNDDGTLFQCTDRDPNHPSEISLAGYPWDITIRASSVIELQTSAAQVIQPIADISFKERYGAELAPLLEAGAEVLK